MMYDSTELNVTAKTIQKRSMQLEKSTLLLLAGNISTLHTKSDLHKIAQPPQGRPIKISELSNPADTPVYKRSKVSIDFSRQCYN
jgi:hypothetical protein